LFCIAIDFICKDLCTRSERPSAEEKMTEKLECTSVREDFEGIFDEGSRPRSRCAEVFCIVTIFTVSVFAHRAHTIPIAIASAPVTAKRTLMNSPNLLTIERCRHFVVQIMATLMALSLTHALAQAPAPTTIAAARYTQSKPSTDGIGKIYMGREIAGIMGWQGAAWLEREEREQEERGELLLRELTQVGLRTGGVIADIGAGTGYYARRMAKIVGRGGTVYAVDVQPQMITMLTEAAKKAGLSNIKPVLGAVDNVKLPDASIDLAIMVDVYHELEFPYEVIESIVRALKPGGRIAFVEYRAEDDRVPIKPVHKMSEEQVRKEAAAHALIYERTANTLPWQHVVIFRKK
jgi:SAM-dependent methyltransferase